jgi:carbonic anhydrase/acetyltransferase-like protein (isoleucine patch superfamily)
VDDETYINPYALLIGEVIVHSGVTIWPGVTIRADDAPVEIGRNTSLLDKALIDASLGHSVTIGEETLISHKAMLIGCTVGSGVLIGKNAVICEDAKIGDGAIISAGSFVLSSTEVPDQVRVTGIPATVSGEVTDEETAEVREKHAEIMKKAREYGGWYVAKQV